MTTPIYYVNARPHLGHAYTTIVCDAIARRKRALGIETWFLTGTDEHGQKIERSAEKAGQTPQQYADAISAEFRGLWDRLGLTYDDFIRTTEERHIRGVQHLFATLRDRGYIYKGSSPEALRSTLRSSRNTAPCTIPCRYSRGHAALRTGVARRGCGAPPWCG